MQTPPQSCTLKCCHRMQSSKLSQNTSWQNVLIKGRQQNVVKLLVMPPLCQLIYWSSILKNQCFTSIKKIWSMSQQNCPESFIISEHLNYISRQLYPNCVQQAVMKFSNVSLRNHQSCTFITRPLLRHPGAEPIVTRLDNPHCTHNDTPPVFQYKHDLMIIRTRS